MSDDVEKLCPAFEAWARENGYEHFDGEFGGPGKQGWWYWNDLTADAWEVWLEKNESAAQPAPASTGREAELTEALRRLCTHEKRSSEQINRDWDHARAVLAAPVAARELDVEGGRDEAAKTAETRMNAAFDDGRELDIEAERREFEAAYCAKWPTAASLEFDKFQRDEFGEYAKGAVFVGFYMWRAARGYA